MKEKIRAGRNRTITLSQNEIPELKEKLLTIQKLTLQTEQFQERMLREEPLEKARAKGV